MDWSALAIVLATVLGPVLAVWASEYRQKKNAEHGRREWVFRTLWATRATPLNPDRVAALNQIDLVFPPITFPKVAEAWALYLGHLNTSAGATEALSVEWHRTAYELSMTLVQCMGAALGINIPMNIVKLTAYHPEAHATLEVTQKEILKLLAEVLRGDRALNVRSKE